MNELDAELAAEATAIQAALERHLPALDPSDGVSRLVDAMRYSLLGGGKRLRSILCLWIHDATGTPRDDAVWTAACALEMIHSYSLIHDDLPAMDDDDLRRGQPSCHLKFDEATAILAGDTLQTEAFSILAALRPSDLAVDLASILASSAGVVGMAAGQQLDLEADHSARGDLLRIHRLKTGRLIGAAAAMGARCAGMAPEAVDTTRAACEELGIAFQMVDDVLDETTDSATLGKTVGKDAAQGKLTAVQRWGVEGALGEAQARLAHTLEALDRVGVLDQRVRALAVRLVEREH